MDSLPKVNIDAINRDLQKLQSLREHMVFEAEPAMLSNMEAGADSDNLEQYLDDDPEDRLKVLENDFTINRKAVFHDIDRLRKWRESLDQDNEEAHTKYEPSMTAWKEVESIPISEANVDAILNKLPDVDPAGAAPGSMGSAALAFLEKKLALETSILSEQGSEKISSICDSYKQT